MRWHEDGRIARRELNKHRRGHIEDNKSRSAYHIGVSPYVVDCRCDERAVRFRKKHGGDWSVLQCGVCHRCKYSKRNKHEHEIKADWAFEEQ